MPSPCTCGISDFGLQPDAVGRGWVQLGAFGKKQAVLEEVGCSQAWSLLNDPQGETLWNFETHNPQSPGGGGLESPKKRTGSNTDGCSWAGLDMDVDAVGRGQAQSDEHKPPQPTTHVTD